uniref:Kinesin motor domain-containing protein n=1 Tax=Zea mays TaxID=4577 RepID=A0A804NYC9_MAIZE
MNSSDADPVIIPRAVRDVFDTVRQADDREFLIRVSYMEIYNEEINDLLTLEGQKLKIHESLDRGVYVSANMNFGETNMNMRSSRSHTIFRMVIESSGKDQTDGGDVIRISVLNLVDLAGSERIIKTGATRAHVVSAILNFSENCTPEILTPYLDGIVNKLLVLLQNGKQMVHMGALTALASVADSSQVLFTWEFYA